MAWVITNKITVKIPIDSFLVLGSRYVVEEIEVQYMFEFNTACNVKFRFDYLLVLSPKNYKKLQIIFLLQKKGKQEQQI